MTIDITKPIKTRNGKKVINLTRKDFNSCGQKVTYPIKGSIVLREKPIRLKYCIWSNDGIYDVVWNNHSELDLI